MSLQTIEDQIDIPSHFICPISQSIMTNPVIASDGNTYEESQIKQWMERSNESPISREPLRTDIVTNRALKEAIEQFIETNKNKINFENIQVVSAQRISQFQKENITLKATALNKTTIKLTIEPENKDSRINTHVVITIDNSGSMSSNAITKDQNGVEEHTGLSLLDIVKHAAKTLISMLGENDYVSIISYSSYAKDRIKMLKMTSINKKTAFEKLDEITPEGQTNLWDGLKLSMDCVKEGSMNPDIPHNASIFILTDGQPNIIPPRGHVKTIDKYLDSSNIRNLCTINTYGFGYNLDSKDLNNISKIGGGSYHFISDPGMVGTTFVNTTSNMLTTIIPSIKVQVELPENVKFKFDGLHELHEHIFTDWGGEFNIGSLRYGQTKDILFEVEPRDQAYVINFTVKSDHCGLNKTVEFNLRDLRSTTIYLDEDMARLQCCQTIKQILSSPTVDPVHAIKIQSYLEDCLREINDRTLTISKFITDLLLDCNQIIEATQTVKAYNKWGKHYLPSLMNAHLMQECNNFKDPGLQYYGGIAFGNIRDEGDDIFNQLPPPKPSRTYGGGYRGGSRTPVTSMRSFNDASSGCFAPGCKVKMMDGSFKPIEQLKKGDCIESNGKYHLVECLVETVSKNGRFNIVDFSDGLKITQYHPIKINNTWAFPCSFKKGEIVDCPKVYNLLLRSGHTIEIDGIECVTLGHGFTEPVVKHNYFGSLNVMTDLAMYDGYKSGFVSVNQEDYRRGGKDNTVISISKTLI
jgi:Mg-chelatase subunit ChlD